MQQCADSYRRRSARAIGRTWRRRLATGWRAKARRLRKAVQRHAWKLCQHAWHREPNLVRRAGIADARVAARGGDQTALAGAVGKFAGLGQGASGSLLGLLAPVVMGTIAKQQGTHSLDASGIASLLASQKDNIAAALPSGFGNLLGGTGLLNSLGGAARTASGAGGEGGTGCYDRGPNSGRYRAARRGRGVVGLA